MDDIMDMHRQGLSPRQIALRTGRTRNSVIGYIWRWKRRGGPPMTPTPVTDAEITKALKTAKGNLSAAARALSMTKARLYRRGFRSTAPRRQNRARGVLTRALVNEIADSGFTDHHIASNARVSMRSIRDWRGGKRDVSPDLANRVRSVLFNKNHHRSRKLVPASVFLEVTQSVFEVYGLSDRARAVAMYLISVTLGYGYVNTAAVFECYHGTVSAAASRVEDWRDDPLFDEKLVRLEQKNSPGY